MVSSHEPTGDAMSHTVKPITLLSHPLNYGRAKAKMKTTCLLSGLQTRGAAMHGAEPKCILPRHEITGEPSIVTEDYDAGQNTRATLAL